MKALNLSKNKKEFENNAYIHTSPNSKVVNIELGEYEFLFKEEGYMLFIYRFIDLDKAVKQAVKRGDFEKTDKAVSGNKVYSFKGTGMSRKKETRFFALQLPAGELLVAPSVKLLVKMYEAGLVPEGTFIRTAKYEFLKNVDSELGSAWCYSDRSLIDRKILEKNEELQGDGEDINMIRNNLESSGEFRLSAVTMGKELRLTSLRVFSDSSVAQGMKEQGDWVVKENYCIKVVATQERSK